MSRPYRAGLTERVQTRITEDQRERLEAKVRLRRATRAEPGYAISDLLRELVADFLDPSP